MDIICGYVVIDYNRLHSVLYNCLESTSKLTFGGTACDKASDIHFSVQYMHQRITMLTYCIVPNSSFGIGQP